MQYIESKSTDPAWNLALEQYLFDSMDREQSYFMLWQNANTVVIGKNQNAEAEFNPAFVREHGIRVVRRLSGGGAVYHDLGNLNYTFIADAGNMQQINFTRFCLPVIETLGEFGVQAEVNGRNDMTIGGRKFSGNSQYIRDGRVLHHGTILFDADLGTVEKALRVSGAKIESKGIPSVRSRVTNISAHLTEKVPLSVFKRRLILHVFEGILPRPYQFTALENAAIERICRDRYLTWAWNFGRSPTCRIRNQRCIPGCGTVEVFMDIADGIIQKIEFFGDYFGSEDLEGLSSLLAGCPHRRENVFLRLCAANTDRFIMNSTPETLAEIIAP